jgi:hypothetical protein
LSVLWRAAVNRDHRDSIKVALTAGEQDQLRTYLLGLAPVPTGLRVVVELVEHDHPAGILRRGADFPYTVRGRSEAPFALHSFSCLGMMFVFLWGPAVAHPVFDAFDLAPSRKMFAGWFKDIAGEKLESRAGEVRATC